MRYIPVTCDEREAMLRAVGAGSVDELFEDIPECARLGRPLGMPDGLTEMELTEHVTGLSRANTHAGELVSFMGAGCYDHYIPAVVDHVVSKPEFFTAYTPYQPEMSQGTLQAIYEFQSMVCLLTGMDVANASMYDGATAMAEAAFMAARVTKRSRVIVAQTMHPEWRRTISTYAEPGVVDEGAVACASGVIDLDDLQKALAADDDIAAVLVQSPNVYGNIEDLAAIGEMAHEAGALLVVGVNPLLLAVMEPPSVYGADIVVGEGQPFGSPMSYGGPGLGIFAASQKSVRQMPGRLVGRTTDVDGNDAFVLTLATREQHIRREKATSNICSNHALNALAAGAYLSAVGGEGLATIARACVAKAHYFRERLLETGRFTAPWDAPFGHEFTLRYEGDSMAMQAQMLERGFFAGVRALALDAEWPALRDDPDIDQLVIFAVTEKRTRVEMDAFVQEVVEG